MKDGKKGIISAAAFLLVLLSVAGYVLISADGGSKDDPLVTLSYVNDVLKPQMTSDMQAAIDKQKTEFSTELDGKIKAADDRLEAKIAEIGKSGTASEAVVNAAADEAIKKLTEKGLGATSSQNKAVWEVVRMNPGQTITCSIGCEIVLRLGSASCVSSGTTGPIDLTAGTVLAPDKGYTENHLYLVTIDGRGIKAGSNGCTVLIKGEYK